MTTATSKREGENSGKSERRRRLPKDRRSDLAPRLIFQPAVTSSSSSVCCRLPSAKRTSQGDWPSAPRPAARSGRLIVVAPSFLPSLPSISLRWKNNRLSSVGREGPRPTWEQAVHYVGRDIPIFRCGAICVRIQMQQSPNSVIDYRRRRRRSLAGKRMRTCVEEAEGQEEEEGAAAAAWNE